jgi:hypothetical protein
MAEFLLGALSGSRKAAIEIAAANPDSFSSARATRTNVGINLALYPVILVALSVAVTGTPPPSMASVGCAVVGLLIGSVEGAVRMRKGPTSRRVYRGCLYGLILGPLGTMIAGVRRLTRTVRRVGFDGFMSDQFDEKTERDRRYGTVYTVFEHAGAYLVRLEMPRRIPASSLKRVWNLPDAMPDYDYTIALGDAVLTVHASVRGETLRRLCYISSAFPADFTTRIDFEMPVSAFKHRLRNKTLEIIVFKRDAEQTRHAA